MSKSHFVGFKKSFIPPPRDALTKTSPSPSLDLWMIPYMTQRKNFGSTLKSEVSDSKSDLQNVHF